MDKECCLIHSATFSSLVHKLKGSLLVSFLSYCDSNCNKPGSLEFSFSILTLAFGLVTISGIFGLYCVGWVCLCVVRCGGVWGCPKYIIFGYRGLHAHAESDHIRHKS